MNDESQDHKPDNLFIPEHLRPDIVSGLLDDAKEQSLDTGCSSEAKEGN
jgi:hypothetical protein